MPAPCRPRAGSRRCWRFRRPRRARPDENRRLARARDPRAVHPASPRARRRSFPRGWSAGAVARGTGYSAPPRAASASCSGGCFAAATGPAPPTGASGPRTRAAVDLVPGQARPAPHRPRRRAHDHARCARRRRPDPPPGPRLRRARRRRCIAAARDGGGRSTRSRRSCSRSCSWSAWSRSPPGSGPVCARARRSTPPRRTAGRPSGGWRSSPRRARPPSPCSATSRSPSGRRRLEHRGLRHRRSGARRAAGRWRRSSTTSRAGARTARARSTRSTRSAPGRAAGLVVARLRDLTGSVTELGPLLQWFVDADAFVIALDYELDTSSRSGELAARALVEISDWERRPRRRPHARRARRHPRGAGRGPRRPGARAPGSPRCAARGMSLQAIADALNEAGVPTLRGGTPLAAVERAGGDGLQAPAGEAARRRAAAR